MKNVTLKILIAASIAIQPTVLYATQGVETTPSSNNASVKDGADKAQSSNSAAKAQQLLSAGLMFAMAAQKYGECSTINKMACVMAGIFAGMGALSLAQSKEHGNVAAGAGLTGNQSDGLGRDPYGYTKPDINDPTNPVATDPNVRALGKNMAKIKGMFDPKTGSIRTPDGKSYKASDFASKSAMAAAGIPNGAALGAIAAYGEIQKKAAAKVEKLKIGAATEATGFDEGGGSGSGSVASSGDEGAGMGVAAATPRYGLDRDPSSLAGMQKNYNGEPIGVAADSIFLMMNRRYKVKESQESFYNDAELALQK